MADIELVIKIDEEIRIAITRMGLLRIPDEMSKVVDSAIQSGKPLPKGHGMSEWIPVSERMPESDVDVLTQYSDYSMSVDFRTASSSGWFWADEDLPIAWMPLPKPYEPQESEDNCYGNVVG